MVKYLLLLDTPFWLLVSTGLIVYISILRRRMAGLKDPRLYLTRGERRAWARNELAQQAEDRDLEQFERGTNIVKGDLSQ